MQAMQFGRTTTALLWFAALTSALIVLLMMGA